MSDPQSEPHPEPVYWCYHCNKRVAVNTEPELTCRECNHGFVEQVPPTPPQARDPHDEAEEEEEYDVVDPALGNQFIQVLRLIAQSSREDSPPPHAPATSPSPADFLRIHLDSTPFNNNTENDSDDDDVAEQQEQEQEQDDEDEDEDEDENESEEEALDEEGIRRRRREVLRLRLRDLATRAANRRNRILDWAEILMGLEDHSIELRLQMGGGDEYVGDPEDYVDAAGYEALLQNLAESGDGRRGAPPASKGAIEGLEEFEVGVGEEVIQCAICKDGMGVGDVGRKLPCGHGYHGECIVPWLGSRNSCPVCRFELETDDVEYEEEKRKRGGEGGGGTSSSAASG